MHREFGNGWKELKVSFLAGRILGLLVEAGLIYCSLHDGHPERIKTNWEGALMIGMVLPAIVGLTALFSIRIEHGWIESVFCRRWVLNRGRISELQRMDSDGCSPAKFYFADGTVIRFIGADQTILREMRSYIWELQPRVRRGNGISRTRAS